MGAEEELLGLKRTNSSTKVNLQQTVSPQQTTLTTKLNKDLVFDYSPDLSHSLQPNKALSSSQKERSMHLSKLMEQQAHMKL